MNDLDNKHRVQQTQQPIHIKTIIITDQEVCENLEMNLL